MDPKAVLQRLCNTCGNPAYNPYRRRNAAHQIVEGCIDDFHTEAMRGLTLPTSAWHFRAEAKKHRAAVKKYMRELTR